MRNALITGIGRELRRHADPLRAAGAKAYMKSAVPFYGVPGPVQKAIWKDVFERCPLDTFEDWVGTALALWRGAKFREERYAAIGLTGRRAYDAYQTLAALPIYEEFIVTGAWWDYVDAVAIHRVGPLLRKYPARMQKTMLRWSRSRDMWKRRSAIICQNTFKADTDLDLLYACIEPNLADREFFIRKGIGWALRQLAWTDPVEVARYVREHDHELSALSRREALKHIGRR